MDIQLEPELKAGVTLCSPRLKALCCMSDMHWKGSGSYTPLDGWDKLRGQQAAAFSAVPPSMIMLQRPLTGAKSGKAHRLLADPSTVMAMRVPVTGD